MRHLHSLKWWQKQQMKIKWISSKQIQWPPYWNNEVFYYCACLTTVICHVKGELWKSKRASNGRQISQIVGCSTSICPKTSNLKSRTVNQDLKTSPNIFSTKIVMWWDHVRGAWPDQRWLPLSCGCLFTSVQRAFCDHQFTFELRDNRQWRNKQFQLLTGNVRAVLFFLKSLTIPIVS